MNLQYVNQYLQQVLNTNDAFKGEKRFNIQFNTIKIKKYMKVKEKKGKKIGNKENSFRQQSNSSNDTRMLFLIS